MLAVPPDNMLGKRATTEELSPDPKKGASSSNMYEALSQQDESLALTDLTQAETDTQPSLM